MYLGGDVTIFFAAGSRFFCENPGKFIKITFSEPASSITEHELQGIASLLMLDADYERSPPVSLLDLPPS